MEGKKKSSKNYRREAKFTTVNQMPLPYCSGQHKQHVLGTELWSCAGKAQVRHLCWAVSAAEGWRSALCPEHVPQWGAFNSCPPDTALLFPPLVFCRDHLLLVWGRHCALPGFVEPSVLPLILSVSAPGWQLQGSYCAQEAERQMVFEVRSYGRTTAKAISLNSQQNRFHQR